MEVSCAIFRHPHRVRPLKKGSRFYVKFCWGVNNHPITPIQIQQKKNMYIYIYIYNIVGNFKLQTAKTPDLRAVHGGYSIKSRKRGLVVAGLLEGKPPPPPPIHHNHHHKPQPQSLQSNISRLPDANHQGHPNSWEISYCHLSPRDWSTSEEGW